MNKKVLTAIKPRYDDKLDTSIYTDILMQKTLKDLEHNILKGGIRGSKCFIDIESLSLLDMMNGMKPKMVVHCDGIEKVIKDMLIGKEIDTIVFDEVLILNRILNDKELEMLSNPCRETDLGKFITFSFDYDTSKPSNNTEWSFKSSSESDINWKDIRDSVDYAEPLALVTRKYRDYDEVTRYVVVSKELMDKAHSINMFEDAPSILDKVSKRAFEIDNNFSDWVSWAKAVKAAKWPDSIKSTVKVILPTV